MGNPIITIDLHGMFRDEAVKVIDKALKTADGSTYQINGGVFEGWGSSLIR